MRKKRGIRPEQNKDVGGSAPSVLRFFVRHGEKVASGALVVMAVWIALQVENHQRLSWKSDELENLADNTAEIILKNEIATEMEVFDFAEYAEQNRMMIPSVPYHSDTAWNPVILPPPRPRGRFEVLSAQSFRGEAIRRAGWMAQKGQTTQWQPPATVDDNASPVRNTASIWINLFGTLPIWEQGDIYDQVFDNIDPANHPKYVYYELAKMEITSKGASVWQPVIFADRLIPFGQPLEALQNQDLLLFSDFDIEPGKTYVYRMRLYIRNPNHNQQASAVEQGVDTTSEFLRSEWSPFARINVPDRTLVQLQSVSPTDDALFPRQVDPLRSIRGTLFLDYFDIEQGLSLPLVEKRNVSRGMLGNMSKDEANRSINRGNAGDIVAGEVVVNYPDAGLVSNVCVMDFSGGRKLQRKSTREAQASPDLFVSGKALLLMPDGTMQATSTEPEFY